MSNPQDDKGAADLHFPLDKGWIPLEYVTSIKCLDPEGNVRYKEMWSRNLHPVEALGMLSTLMDTTRARLMQMTRRTRE